MNVIEKLNSIKNGEMTAKENVENFIKVIDENNETINAFLELNKENAPNILLEDFNYFANKAVNNYINGLTTITKVVFWGMLIALFIGIMSVKSIFHTII